MDYTMKNRTYRYSKIEPLYPFGYGLSYTRFQYSDLNLSRDEISVGNSLEISVNLKNLGNMIGDEVIELYIKNVDAPIRVPQYELRRFKRLTLSPHEQKKITFNIEPRDLALIDMQGNCILEPSKFKIYIGGQQPDNRSESLSGSQVLEKSFLVNGSKQQIEY
jgi:beta-glucosidase